MVDAAPFRALRYNPAVSGELRTTTAPAYDEIDSQALARHRGQSPYTILGLYTPDGPAGGFDTAGATLRRWLRTGVLVREQQPAYYLYEQHELRHGRPAVVHGVLAALALGPLGAAGGVLPHEEVDPERVRARAARLAAVPLDISPVTVLVDDLAGPLHTAAFASPTGPPLVAFTDERGVDHRVWRLADERQGAALRQALRPLAAVIADGHHRYASALAVLEGSRATPAGRAAAAPAGSPPGARATDARAHAAADADAEPRRWTLAYLVDARRDGPQVLPLHRLTRLPTGLVLDALTEDFLVTERSADALRLAEAVARSSGVTFGLRLPGPRGYLLRARDRGQLAERLPAASPAAWRTLDAALLEYAVLPRLRADRTRATADAAAGAAAVDRGDADALWLLPPVPATEVSRLAHAGVLMPAKTTFFAPKPRTGLILRDAGARFSDGP